MSNETICLILAGVNVVMAMLNRKNKETTLYYLLVSQIFVAAFFIISA
jgi:heme/copper-type cytochrome/quinol oxidase subunit 3